MKVAVNEGLGVAERSWYDFGPFRLDVGKGRLLRDNETLHVTRKAIETLTALVARAGEVVEKDDLMKLVWPDTFVTEDTLTQNISTLRKVLGDTADVPRYIVTVPRRGYRFIGLVRPEEGQPLLPKAPQDGGVLPVGGAAASPSKTQASHGHRERLWMAIAALSLLAGVGLGTMLGGRSSPEPDEALRFAVAPPRGWTLISSGVISPNGRRLAFVARDLSGRRVLMVRESHSLEAISLRDTDSADQPFWSPDGELLAFFADGKLKKVDVSGGPVVTLADAGANPQGGTWNEDDVILYAPGRFSGIFRVSASGGSSTPVTLLEEDGRQSGHWWPQFLPDGRRFLFTVAGADAQRAGLYSGSLDSPEVVRILDASSTGAVYTRPDHLLYVRDGNLMAQPFDNRSLRVGGAASPLATGVPSPDMIVGPGVTASNDGVIAYLTDSVGSRLAWFDRAGRVLSSIAGPSRLRSPALSPDERFVTAYRQELGSAHLWMLELDRGVASRLTTVSTGQLGVWSPDGASMVYSSDRWGSLDLYLRSTSGPDVDELLVRSHDPKRAFDWSRDGQFIVYGVYASRSKQDLWLLPMEGEREPVPFLETPFNEGQAKIAPDNRWIAYASDESGGWEIYVQSFPQLGRKRRISTTGGAQPAWRGDGRELFYLAPDGRLMAVPIMDSATMQVGAPVPLFQTSVPGALDTYRNYFVATSDGQRFLIDSRVQENSDIAVLKNWSSLVAGSASR